MKTVRRHWHQRGFTLIELLVSIAIILILVGILIPTINVARNKAKKAMAFSEMKSLESAWREYLSTYRKPPTAISIGLRPVLETWVEISGEVANLLKGQNIAGLNPQERTFMEFNRVDSDGDPITPWGSLTASENRTSPYNLYYYYVKFDRNFDRKVRAGAGEPTDPPNADIGRDFIVWTYYPRIPSGEEGHVLRSWEQ